MKKPFGVVAAFAMLVAGCAALFATLLLATRYWRVATTPEGVILTFEVDRDSLVDDQPVDMQAMVTVLDWRLNPGWPVRARVRQVGRERIDVATFTTDPGEVQRITRRVQSLGMLEFRVLANERDHKELIERARREHDARTLRNPDGTLAAWWVPVRPGQEESIAIHEDIAIRESTQDGRSTLEVLVVKDPFDVTGRYLARAAPGVTVQGRPCVEFTFNSQGGHLFGGLTGSILPDEAAGFRRHLGIILDGYLDSAPAVLDTIYRRGEITGDFTREEVEDLAHILNAGSLPAPLKKVGVRGPGGSP